MIYLAAPYTHRSRAVQALRQRIINVVAAHIAATDRAIYSPITMGTAIAHWLPPEQTDDHAFWMRQCLPHLDRATSLLILRLPGWQDSRGVQLEIEHARRLGIPQNACDPQDWVPEALIGEDMHRLNTLTEWRQ